MAFIFGPAFLQREPTWLSKFSLLSRKIPNSFFLIIASNFIIIMIDPYCRLPYNDTLLDLMSCDSHETIGVES